jgi:hypothetical protein
MNDRAASTRLASPMKGRPADKLPVSFRPKGLPVSNAPHLDRWNPRLHPRKAVIHSQRQ